MFDLTPNRCEEEIRQCQLSYIFDKDFTDIISAWHQKCDSKIATPVTTPAIPSLTVTVDYAACVTIIDSCSSWSADIVGCPTTAEASNSCRCESSVMSLASVCFVDGNKTCIGTTGDTSNLWEFQSCPAATLFQTVSPNPKRVSIRPNRRVER